MHLLLSCSKLFYQTSRVQHLSNMQLNGNTDGFGGQFQFVNETDTIITGQGDYNGGIKRSAGDAGFDSDGEIDRNLGSTSGGSDAPGKKTRGRVKIEMRFIENKLRRYTTFSKRKTGIMKKVRITHHCIALCCSILKGD